MRTRWVHMRSFSLELLREEWISETPCSADAVLNIEPGEHGERLYENVVVTDDLSEFVARMVDGDELRTFRNSSESWQRRHGRMGFVIMRDGQPVDAVLTAMN